MRRLKRTIAIVVAACVLAALAVGVGYAQNTDTTGAADLTLPSSASQEATQDATQEDSSSTTQEDSQESGSSLDAVEQANAILAADAASDDDGFEDTTSGTFAEALNSGAISTLSSPLNAFTASGESSVTDETSASDDVANTSDGDATLASVDDNSGDAEADETTYKYLSTYTPIVSEIGWKTRLDDVNYDGNKISLIVNGQRKYFHRGVSMHAKATVVYDLGADCPYDTFETYMGVDASRGSNGWAKITVYTSTDNANWTQVAVSNNGNGSNGNTEATHITISLNGARYLKFYCDPLNGNGADHTCLGGAVVYDSATYVDPTENAPVVSKIADLDAALEGYSNADILATRGTSTAANPNTPYMNMLRRSLVEKVTYSTLAYLFLDCTATEKQQRTDMLTWLWNDEQALEDFVTGGTPNSGGYEKSLIVLSNLYAQYGSDLSDTTALFVDANGGQHDGPASCRGELYRIVMIAIALTHDNGPYMWQASGVASDPLERYANYKIAYEDNILRNDVYENLTVEEMRWVMGGRIWNDEIYWLNRYAWSKRPTAGYPTVYSPHAFIGYGKDWNYDQKGYFDPDNYAQYEEKYGLSSYPIVVTAPSLTTKLSKCWMALEGSQICWGISYLGTTFANSYGVPSKYVRQAGHAAFFVYNRDSQGRATWNIDNNISGWTATWVNEDTVGNGNARMMCDWGTRGTSNVSDKNATYIQLCTTAQDHIDDYEKAEALISLVSSCTTTDEKIALYQDVLAIMPYHWDAWRGLVNIYKSEKSATEMAELAQQLTNSMWYFPLPMHDLVNQLYTAAKVTDVSAAALIAQYESLALDKGSKANSNGASSLIAQTDVCVTMANYLKGTLSTQLASFSFDGTNAGKIVFGSTYEGVRYRISLDGGKTWTATGANITSSDKMYYDLSDQISSVNATDDILIWLEGWTGTGTNCEDPIADNAFRIDILAGTSTSNLYRNDNEDRFLTVTGNVEYYISDTAATVDNPTWSKLTTSDKFEGDVVVHVRIAASGRQLAGSESTFTFTDTYTDVNHSYITIDRITYDSCSSEETSSAKDQACHVTDGLLTTRWHTLWNGSDSGKWVTLKLDEPTYVSQVKYTPIADAGNGTISALDVYVSSDNLTWIYAGSGSWACDNTVKTCTFDHAVYGQYVKIQATKTKGNYASARLFELYEDKEIASKTATGFTVTAPTKTTYVEGEKIDLSGLTATFSYTDNTTAQVPYTHLIPSETYLYLSDPTASSEEKTIYLSCGDFAPQPITVTVTRNTTAASAISIAQPADQLTYYVGDELSLDGLRIQATCGDATVLLPTTAYNATADLTKEGTATVTITYDNGTETTDDDCTTSYEVTVKRAVASLKIINKPTKNTYLLGETLDTEGLEVHAVYDDDSETVLAASDYVLLGTEGFGETPGDIELQVALADKETICAPLYVMVYPYFLLDGIRYELTTYLDETCVFVTAFSSDADFVRIPDTVKVGSRTLPVRGVESGAMTDITGVTSIALPGSIRKIETGAFTGGEAIDNIYLTEHSSFDDLSAEADAFDSDTNLVLLAGTSDLTEELSQKDFAEGLQVKDVTDDITEIKLEGTYPTTFNRGETFTSEGLQVTGVLTDGNIIALAPTAYTVSTPDMTTKGEKTVTVTPLFTNSHNVSAKAYTIEVKQVSLKITDHPDSAVYYRGESGDQVAALSVEAVSEVATDELTYQWYRIAGSAPDPAADIIAGATESTYRPTTSGSYYAIVSVAGQEDHSVQSMTATVEMGKYTAIVGNKGYTSLNAAVAAASGQTVHLLEDVTITSGISVSHSFTLDGLDPIDGTTRHKITRGEGFVGAFVTASTSAVVTLSNVILDGGAIWQNWEVATIQRGTGNAGIAAQAPLLVALETSKIYLNSGTILQNNGNAYQGGAPADNCGGAIRARGSAQIFMDGAQIRDCYTYWFGSAVYFRDSTSLTISGDSVIHGCSGSSDHNTTALCADNNATLTINGGTFCHNLGYNAGGVIWASHGKIYINGGNFVDNDLYNNANGKGKGLYLFGTTKVYINDYTALQDIYLDMSKNTQSITITGDLSDNAELTINSSKTGVSVIQASSTDLLAAAAGNISINGKSAVIDNGKITAEGEGSHTKVATVANGDAEMDFTSFAEALSYISADCVVDLHQDAAVESAITVDHPMRIDTNGYTITGLDNISVTDDLKKASYEDADDNIVYVIADKDIVRDELKFAAASLTLQDNLLIKYKVDKTLASTYDKLWVEFTIGSGDSAQTRTVEVVTSSDSKYLEYWLDDISPDKMADNICAVLYAKSDDTICHSLPKNYSVKKYCENILTKYNATDYPKYASLRTLLVDTLSYGAAYQTYTGNTEKLATADLTTTQKEYGTTDKPTLVNKLNLTKVSITNPKVSWYGVSLKLTNTIAIRYHLKIDDSISASDLTLKITSGGHTWTLPATRLKETTFSDETSGYEVVFSGLNAAQLSDEVTATVYKGTTAVSNTLAYSVESYAYAVDNTENITATDSGKKLDDLVVAMMRYGNAAKAYSSSNK